MTSLVDQTNPDKHTVHAIIHERYGEPGDMLHAASIADPGAPAGNQVRIRVTRVPIHPGDLLSVQGASIGGASAPIPSGQPHVPGLEGIGLIEALGPEVEGHLSLTPGQRVAFFPVSGAWSQAILAPASSVIPVPDDIADRTAAQMLINTITARLILRATIAHAGKERTGDISTLTARLILRAGHHCLPADIPLPVQFIQTAAGSAVGRLITVLALELGLKPLRLVRTRDGAERLQTTLPGAPVFSLSDGDWPEQVRQSANGHPIIAALDAVGGSFLDSVIPLLADGSAIISYGLLGGGHPDLGAVVAREIRILGVSIGRWAETTPPPVREEDVATAIRLARTKPELFEVAGEYAFANIRQAIDHASRPGKRGTVLLAA